MHLNYLYLSAINQKQYTPIDVLGQATVVDGAFPDPRKVPSTLWGKAAHDKENTNQAAQVDHVTCHRELLIASNREKWVVYHNYYTIISCEIEMLEVRPQWFNLLHENFFAPLYSCL